jgi:hypothetical protein
MVNSSAASRKLAWHRLAALRRVLVGPIGCRHHSIHGRCWSLRKPLRLCLASVTAMSQRKASAGWNGFLHGRCCSTVMSVPEAQARRSEMPGRRRAVRGRKAGRTWRRRAWDADVAEGSAREAGCHGELGRRDKRPCSSIELAEMGQAQIYTRNTEVTAATAFVGEDGSGTCGSESRDERRTGNRSPLPLRDAEC